MHIKVIQPEKDGIRVYDNSEGVDALIEYLKHEEKEEEKKLFLFNQDQSNITPNEAKEKINNNVKGLRKGGAKFYSIVISPSEDELRHIGNSDKRLRQYTRKVMQHYASTYKLKKGRSIGSKDVVWVAAIHEDRKIKAIDLKQEELLSERERELMQGGIGQNEIEKIRKRAEQRDEKRYDPELFRVGERKPGLNKHIHVIVSARDRAQKITLNPLTVRNRFHIKDFQLRSGRSFEKMFGYEHDTMSRRFYDKYDRKERLRFEERIDRFVERLRRENPDIAIDSEKLKNIGAKYHYSKVFFINLSRLSGKYKRGEAVGDPYFFIEKGRVEKASEHFKRLENRYPLEKSNFNTIRIKSARLSTVIQSARSPLEIKETLLLASERKRIKRHKEKGQDGDNIEVS
ncbi:MAG: DUF5712 family protein [Bacteroidota bacterium]